MTDIQAALFDVDGTLTAGGQMWQGLLKSPDVQKSRIAWLYLTAVPHHLLSRAGAVSQAQFRDRWVRLMAWLMTGWSEAQVQHLYSHIAQDYLIPDLRPDVVSVLKNHKQQGHYVALVSTMFEGILRALADHVGADAGIGSQVAMVNGQCTGRIVGPACSGARKLDFAREHLAGQVPLDACTAYADSKSDIEFLSGVGYPVATYPDDAMRLAAEKRGWRIYTG